MHLVLEQQDLQLVIVKRARPDLNQPIKNTTAAVHFEEGGREIICVLRCHVVCILRPLAPECNEYCCCAASCRITVPYHLCFSLARYTLQATGYTHGLAHKKSAKADPPTTATRRRRHLRRCCQHHLRGTLGKKEHLIPKPSPIAFLGVKSGECTPFRSFRSFSRRLQAAAQAPRAKTRLVAPRGLVLATPHGAQRWAHQPARRGRASCRAVSVTRIAPTSLAFARRICRTVSQSELPLAPPLLDERDLVKSLRR